LQLGHKDTKTRVPQGIPLSLLFTPNIKNGKGWLHIYFYRDAMSLFRVTKSTGGLLALVKASDPPSALEAYARMRPLELCKACFRMWSSLCRGAEGIRDSRGGQRPALLMGSPE